MYRQRCDDGNCERGISKTRNKNSDINTRTDRQQSRGLVSALKEKGVNRLTCGSGARPARDVE